ncbi:MAG: diaminopropionate ammonia-lyase [Oscillospiraceae bacterium]
MKITDIQRKHGAPALFTRSTAAQARAFHETLAGYEPTPLVRLDGLAEALGLRGLYVKDESRRFGLNAFKALGGSYAMHGVLEENPAAELFVTATDGNHGRGVAWAAQRMGKRAVVFLPAGSSEERLQNIRALGAQAEITALAYDDCVRYAARYAAEHGGTLLQDTAWDGYEAIPEKIMQGYTTMGLEIVEQLREVRPTHIFLQAGVGAMAGAMAGFFADVYGAERPVVTIVEPEGADCIFRTAQAADGALHPCPELHTIMAGLSCGEPCTIGWEQIAAYADFCLTCPDETAEEGMRLLAKPCGGDAPIVSGESGAVTVGAAAQILRRAELAGIRERLGLGENAVILCISTEGDTDKQNYRAIVFGGGTESPRP